MSEVTWWWLSFCDTDLPKGSQFLGACVVEGADIVAATKRALDLKINPGGEVAGVQVHPDRVPPESKNRLLTKSEAERLFT